MQLSWSERCEINMYYLDTNVIIAYGFREEAHHKIARKAVEELRGPFCISAWSLVELAAVLSRQTKVRYRFPPEIEQFAQDPRDKIDLTIRWLLKKLNVERILPDRGDLLRDHDYNTEITIEHLKAIELALKMAFRHIVGAGDIMHFVYMINHGIKDFMTLEDKIEKSKDILATLGVHVIRVK